MASPWAGEEHWSSGRTAALGFGFAGLAVLFGPQIVVPTDPLSLLGAAAIVLSAVVYSLGSYQISLISTHWPSFAAQLT